MKIILATKNKGKIKEINRLFSDLHIEFTGISNDPNLSDIKEDGNTYHENALKKASTTFKKAGLTVVSEDSGLEVDALDRAPGIFSARFAGENATDSENIKKLLNLIKNIPAEKRTARFVSVFCLIENGKETFFEGEVRGSLVDTPRGESGFGYDPIFIPDGYNNTFAELGDNIKNRISHRANAISKLKKYLSSHIEKLKNHNNNIISKIS